MARLSSLDEIARLYAERGDQNYGEGVTQIEHALQCATLARQDGAPDSLVIAALLHDIGHLFEDERAQGEPESDARHESTGVLALKGLFAEAVCKPIALHVAAKRYLCFKEPGYARALSAASQYSLRLQGGAFNADQARAFERQPYWRQALALRGYDDLGKRAEPIGGALADFMPLMAELARSPAP